MNYPEVIEYSYNGDKFRAEYTFDEFYDVCVWSENESVGPFLKDQEIELGWWIMYYHHSYEGIIEMINEQKENNMEQQTIKQMEQNVAELLAKAEEMKQLIEKVKKEQTWPNYQDVYWYAESNGTVYSLYWANSYDDNNRFKFGNVHRSKVEAEDYVQKRLVQAELERLAAKAWKDNGADSSWENHNHKHHIYYSHSVEDFVVDANTTIQYIGQMFFPTETSAYDAIETIGEERLKVLLK